MKTITRKIELYVKTVTMKGKEKTKITTSQSKINKQRPITLTLTITMGKFWLVLVFQVKHILC